MPLQKNRILMLAPDCNKGKVCALDALLAEYIAYVGLCVQRMLQQRVPLLPRSQKQAFFPRASHLSSQIEKNARDHAIAIVSGWFLSAYTNRVSSLLARLLRDGQLEATVAQVLHLIGRGQQNAPPEAVERYWQLLLSVVKPPSVTERIGIWWALRTSALQRT